MAGKKNYSLLMGYPLRLSTVKNVIAHYNRLYATGKTQSLPVRIA
jgi:hypothetical protein